MENFVLCPVAQWQCRLTANQGTRVQLQAPARQVRHSCPPQIKEFPPRDALNCKQDDRIRVNISNVGKMQDGWD